MNPQATYICSSLAERVDGSFECVAWIQNLVETSVDPQLLFTAFVVGFGAIFSAWSVGFTASVVVGMIRKL